MSAARDRLLKQFRDLVGERLSRIGNSLMALEGGANIEAGKLALRELHGLKGEARMMGFADINKIVHEMEEVVRSVERGGYARPGGSADALLVASDAVQVLPWGGAEDKPAAPPPEVDKI